VGSQSCMFRGLGLFCSLGWHSEAEVVGDKNGVYEDATFSI
jgi:hypothetical protein